MTTTILHAINGQLVKWRGSGTIIPPTPVPSAFMVRAMQAGMAQVTDPNAPMPRPTGPGTYRIEDLNVGNDLVAACTAVQSKAAGPDGRKILTLPPGIWEATGFSMSDNYLGFLIPPGVSIVGSGPEHTIFRVKENTITQAQVDRWYAPMDVYPGVTLLRVMQFYQSDNLLLAQFAVEGTAQRVNGTGIPKAGYDTYHYNGIQLSRVTNSTIRDVKVFGVPGYRNSPPGETFLLAFLRCDGLRFERCELDGRDRNGVRRGAAGLGSNTSTNIYVEDSRAHHMGYSHGFAFWETNGIQLFRCIADYNGAVASQGGAALGGTTGDGFNFERSRNSLMVDCKTGFNSLCEVRYYARNDGNAFDGDTAPHEIRNMIVTDTDDFDIRIDNLQRTLPIITNSPIPVYSLNPKGQA